MTVLPEAFIIKMKQLLGEEFDAFLGSYEGERVQGLRINGLKKDSEAVVRDKVFTLERIPWCEEGYYYRQEERPGRHPYHEAGVYYIQEPSAMAVVQLLDPRPGELILDLCAAPGGKSTHIASRLQGQGFLLSNEIHPARAKILSQNVERMGIANAVVTNEDAFALAKRFPEYFDRIVVDAPCSGEGMFRKDENAAAQWSPDNVILCAARQAEILDEAASMLKPGGRLVYSTCTFSPEENEGSIENFLSRNPAFVIEETDQGGHFDHGHPEWVGGRETLKQTIRIWPHKTEGEGHYMAVLKKQGEASESKRSMPVYVKDKSVKKIYREFAENTLVQDHAYTDPESLVLFGDQLYLLPKEMLSYDGLKVVRPGLHLGMLKKNRFEPSHALALNRDGDQVIRSYDMNEKECAAYLNGEALTPVKAPGDTKGWVLMTYHSYSVGWAKSAGGILKNHYPKGLRYRMEYPSETTMKKEVE